MVTGVFRTLYCERSSTFSRAKPPQRVPLTDTFGRYYGRRKDAVKQILQWSHTKHDLANVVQHIDANGQKGDLVTRRQHLWKFLQMSLTGALAPDAQEMDDYYDSPTAMLKTEPTPGYAVAPVDSHDYGFPLTPTITDSRCQQAPTRFIKTCRM